MSELATTRLEDVLEPRGLSYGVVQPGQADPGGVPIVRVADMVGGTIDQGNPLRVSAQVEAAHERTRLRGREVLVSIVGTVGRVAVVPKELEGWNVARAVAVLRPSAIDDSQWLRYALLAPAVQDQMQMRKTDTVQATLNLRDLRTLVLPWPDPVERRRIASVLGALDDLIENNRSTIGHLRALMVATYEAASESGDFLPFGELATQVRDGVPSGRLSAGTPYLGLEHFGTDGAGISSVGDSGSVDSNKSRFRAGDVLYGKLRPYFRKFDRPGFDGVCSTELWVLRPRAGWGAATLHAIVARPEFTEFAMAGNTGTRMPRANWAQVASMPVPVPCPDRRESLDRRLDEMWRGVVELSLEMTTLARGRDELLPLLMSGQVRVSADLAVA